MYVSNISLDFFFRLLKDNRIMKGVQLHNNFARRRELEQMRIENSAAVEKYYDKWGQITTR